MASKKHRLFLFFEDFKLVLWGVHVTMYYFVGFVIWWIVFGVIWVGIYFFERQTMKLVDMSKTCSNDYVYTLYVERIFGSVYIVDVVEVVS